jgi:hypothetical protein
MRSHLPARRLIALATIASLTAFSGAALTAPAAAANPGAAAPPTVSFISLFGNSVGTTSTSHVHLKVSVGSSKAPSTASEDSTSVTISTRTFAETHSWSFPTPATGLAVSSAGKGRLTLGAKTGPYGTIALRVAPNGHAHTQMCQGQPLQKSMPVTIGGVFVFKTHSAGAHKWGNLGSQHFHFGTGTVTWTYNNQFGESCQNFSTPCTAGIQFGATNGANSVFGSKFGSAGSVQGTKTVKLARPHGATRNDSVNGGAKVSLKVAHNGDATLKVTGTGLAKGTATFKSSAAAQSFPAPCGKNGAKHVNQRSWNGSYHNGTPALQLKAQVFGAIKVANIKQGPFFDESTK